MKKYMFFLILFLIPFNCYAISDSARSSIVMDIESGRVLYQNNANEKRLIASITKVMTATVALENTKDLNKKVKAGEEVLKMYGTSIYMEKGETLTMKDLLYGLMLRSGNDAAVVIANGVSKNEKDFVKLMNQKAQKLQMTNTTFKNCHGLDEETKNYSTAYDMALLSRYIYNKDSTYRKIINTYKYTTQSNNKSYLWYNRNTLLKQYKYCIGGKTGYTPSAGKTLISVAKKNNLILTAVSIKDADHYENHEQLYESIFNKYKRYQLLDKKHFSVDEEYYKDDLYIKDDFYYPLTSSELKKVKTIVKITKLKNYKDNDVVGEVNIKLEDQLLKKVPIYVYKKEKKKRFFF
ncbi:MAG: D-alanyl-D-alanine carboxypeptidase [Bacilli bacterium]|nr:D-alanyl-D-alanine carboxypeptidase [Bacilli bacterium]